MHLHVENRGQRQVVYHPPFGEGGRASHWPGAPSRLDCTVSSNGLPVSVCLPSAGLTGYTPPYLTCFALVLRPELSSSFQGKHVTD